MVHLGTSGNVARWRTVLQFPHQRLALATQWSTVRPQVCQSQEGGGPEEYEYFATHQLVKTFSALHSLAVCQTDPVCFQCQPHVWPLFHALHTPGCCQCWAAHLAEQHGTEWCIGWRSTMSSHLEQPLRPHPERPMFAARDAKRRLLIVPCPVRGPCPVLCHARLCALSSLADSSAGPDRLAACPGSGCPAG